MEANFSLFTLHFLLFYCTFSYGECTHIEKTQINLVFCSLICTFAADLFVYTLLI
jgi:hypothetical protein